jgi:hypothetical protein
MIGKAQVGPGATKLFKEAVLCYVAGSVDRDQLLSVGLGCGLPWIAPGCACPVAFGSSWRPAARAARDVVLGQQLLDDAAGGAAAPIRAGTRVR